MIFAKWREVEPRFFVIDSQVTATKQSLTNEAFSEKWSAYSNEDEGERERFFEFQKDWFLRLYGFGDEAELAAHLSNFEWILDAGCGLGYKAAWFASLAPGSTVIGIDYSSAAYIAYTKYADAHKNLIFAKGDIAATNLPDGAIGLAACDQVIMHTEDPALTLQELSRITSDGGEVFCYWYRKKAVPRELLDDFFRSHTAQRSSEELWKLSKEVLSLGKMLSELDIQADFPDVPSLGIVGGKMDLQRFIYWNFIKCFWNEELGYATSLSTNFDWYSPVNAKRFSLDEVSADVQAAGLTKTFFNEEESCFSGRFVKQGVV
jgi:SAM-dependent methyltransferase